MQLAVEDAGVAPGDIAAVFAAANGARRLDPLEAAAIRAVFPADVPVVSIKGAVGESGAAGAAALAVGLVTAGSGELPPTYGFQEPDPSCPVRVSDAPQRAAGPLFIANAIASGGTNYSIVARAADNGSRSG